MLVALNAVQPLRAASALLSTPHYDVAPCPSYRVSFLAPPSLPSVVDPKFVTNLSAMV